MAKKIKTSSLQQNAFFVLPLFIFVIILWNLFNKNCVASSETVTPGEAGKEGPHTNYNSRITINGSTETWQRCNTCINNGGKEYRDCNCRDRSFFESIGTIIGANKLGEKICDTCAYDIKGCKGGQIDQDHWNYLQYYSGARAELNVPNNAKCTRKKGCCPWR